LLSSNIILDPDRLRKEVEYIYDQGRFFYDVESIPSSPGADDRGVPAHNQVTWMGLASRGRTCLIPMGHPIGSKIIGETRIPKVGKDGKTRNYRHPVYEKPPEQMDRSTVFGILNPLFADPDIEQGSHGATFDAASVAKYRGGLIPSGPVRCTILMRWLTDENRMRYGLKYITKDIYGFQYDDENVGREVEKYALSKVAHYLHCDVRYGYLEMENLRPVILDSGLGDLWEMETELTSVLAEMRTQGTLIDTVRLEELRMELGTLVQQRERNVYTAVGRKINLNSAPQKQALLFKPVTEGGLGLIPWKLTKGGKEKKRQGLEPDHTFYSTDDEALAEFRGNPVVDTLLEYQETNKVYGTYVIGYLGDPDDKEKPGRIFDHRIYPDFVQYGTSTGRMSCRNPNLQNVPAARTELGKMVRSLFISDDGWDLIVADYGQVELVILAHFAGQGAMLQGFLDGIDPHTMTAAMVLGKEPADVTKNERQRFGKSLNFAVVFGAGPAKVAAMAEMEVTYEDIQERAPDIKSKARWMLAKGYLDDAQYKIRMSDQGIHDEILRQKGKELLDLYDEQFPEVGELRKKVLAEARRHPEWAVPTLLGRLRRLPDLAISRNDPNRKGLLAYAERQAFNSKIQGSNADINKLAMIEFRRRKQQEWKMLLVVHDELVVTSAEADTEAAKECLIQSMTGPHIQDLLSVPLTVDVTVVKNWASAK
jgi:DNA polymerase I-like protein with 3'-5' exonuclease and polymerase domains